MRVVFFSILLTALIAPLNAQNVFGEAVMSEAFVKSGTQNLNSNRVIENGYIDSNYYNAILNGNEKASEKLRYNALEDEMEFIRNGKRFFMDKANSMEVVFDDPNKTVYKSFEYSVGKVKYNGYLKELYKSDKFSLYKKESIIRDFDKAKDNFAVNSGQMVYKNDAIVYLLKKGDDFIKVPRSVNALSKSVNNSDLILFVKKNNLDLSKESHLKLITSYLNEETNNVEKMLEILNDKNY